MYFLYCFIIWLGVYTVPALAFFPRLLFSPKTAFAVPILSAFIIYLLSTLLLSVKGFTPIAIHVWTLSFMIVAGGRIFKSKKILSTWTKQDLFIYIFHIIILLPYCVKLGITAFDRGDEIYSWNFWAIQHYFQEQIDFSHTGAPYPQLFPKLLGYCYHLLGSIDLQLPVKATLIVFPWSMLVAIAMCLRPKKGIALASYLLTLGYVLGIVGLEAFFNDGYADPIMSAALIVSVALLWSHSFFLAVIAGLCAAFAKQPGLLWALFALPLVLIYKKKPILALMSFLGGFCWLLGEGGTFYQNQGVISLSLGQRDLWTQLSYASQKYFVEKPALLMLFLAALICVWRNALLRLIFLLFFLPGLFCWFIFGAYQLRLGQHLIALAFFIIVASGFAYPKWIVKGSAYFIAKAWQWHKPILTAVMMVFISFAAGVYFREGNEISYYLGSRQSLERYFGQESQKIYDEIMTHSELRLWVPSRYLYGLFYKHTKLLSPDYAQNPVYDLSVLVKELKTKEPDYVFTVEKTIADGVASTLLNELITSCPHAFIQIIEPYQKFEFKAFKVNKTLLQQDACLAHFEQKGLIS